MLSQVILVVVNGTGITNYVSNVLKDGFSTQIKIAFRSIIFVVLMIQLEPAHLALKGIYFQIKNAFQEIPFVNLLIKMEVAPVATLDTF